MALTTAMLRGWFQQYNQSGVPIYIDKMPEVGQAIYIVMQPGAGLELEGLIDNPAFTVRCRGGENNFSSAETIALHIDKIVLEHGFVAQEFEGVQFYLVDRSGGRPQLINTADTQSRYTFSCNYYAKVSTNIGEDYN